MVLFSADAWSNKVRILLQFRERFIRTSGGRSTAQLAAMVYIASLMTFALLTVLPALASWQSGNLWLFFAYLAIVVLSPRFRIGIAFIADPGLLNSLVILLGIIQLPAPHALAL